MERLAETSTLVHLASLALGCLDALDMEKPVERTCVATALGSASVHVFCGLDCQCLNKKSRTYLASIAATLGLLGRFRFAHFKEKRRGTD